MNSKIITTVFIFALLAVISGCMEKKVVEDKTSAAVIEEPQIQPKTNDLRVSISGVITPKETLNYYQELLAYVSHELDLSIILIQRDTYQEVNDLVRDGAVDIAFVCSGAYVYGYEESGMEILVAPVVNGAPVYYSYLIVPRDSDASSINDLKGKKFAFTDPLSNSGTLYPRYALLNMNETPDTFFSEYIYTYNHDKSIVMVGEKIVDGANVDSLIWDYINQTKPEVTSKTKIIGRSPPFGIPPVVVSKYTDQALKEKLKTFFLHIHESDEGKQILQKIMIDEFTEISDSSYDFIREMNERVKAQNAQ